MKKSNTNIFIVAGIVVILVIVVVANVNRSQTPPVSSPTPTVHVDRTKEWRSYEFKEVSLAFRAPPEMSVTGEKPDQQTFTLYVQRSDYPADDYYQLYGLYNLSAKDAILEDLISELETNSVKKSVVDGFAAVSGQFQGERNRFVTYIVTDKGLFTLATSQPTTANEKLTAEILSTFTLK